MKQSVVCWFAALTLLVGVVVPLVMHAQPPAAVKPTAAISGQSNAGGHHPNIESAIQSLQQAKAHLEEAEKYEIEEHKPDLFKGHRAKALTMVDQAIHECHDALEAAAQR